MKVEISVLKQNCEHLKEISRYNSNFYRLPFVINGCDVLHEKYNGAEDWCGNSIGTVKNGEYTVQFYLHALEKSGMFLFDSSSMGKKNEWT